VQVYAIALIRQGTILKTSSGKIQRNACRAAFVKGKLEIEAEWRESAPSGEGIGVAVVGGLASESPLLWLQKSFAALLHVSAGEIDLHQPITRYGLDSLMLVDLSHSIEEKFGVSIPLSTLLESISVTDLAERLPQAHSPRPTGSDHA